MPFIYERKVRFDEVDAARIVFFARFFHYCHEAMEALFDDALEGGYVHLVKDRQVGLPAVHVDADFASPLRYGDVVRIHLDVPRVGHSSATLHYRLERVGDGVEVATITHIVVATDMERMCSVPLPDDVRKALELEEEQAPRTV